MRVHIASDHAGLELKEKIIEHLKKQNHDVTDHGPYQYDAQDDYPKFCIPAAQAAAADPNCFAIVLGGSGNGEQIAANKVAGVRAGLVWSIETAKLAREHNNANVIAIGGRLHEIDFCLQLVDTFLATPFTNDERHLRRIGQITKFEQSGSI